MYSPGGERKLHLAEDKKEVALKFFLRGTIKNTASAKGNEWRALCTITVAPASCWGHYDHCGGIFLFRGGSFHRCAQPQSPSDALISAGWISCAAAPTQMGSMRSHFTSSCVVEKAFSCVYASLLCCVVGLSWKLTLAPIVTIETRSPYASARTLLACVFLSIWQSRLSPGWLWSWALTCPLRSKDVDKVRGRELSCGKVPACYLAWVFLPVIWHGFSSGSALLSKRAFYPGGFWGLWIFVWDFGISRSPAASVEHQRVLGSGWTITIVCVK